MTRTKAPSAPSLPRPGSVPAVSFDVFDTCITRNLGRPTDLFFILAKKTLEDHGLPADFTAVHELARYRIECERTARRRAGHGLDMPLSALYQAYEQDRAFGVPGPVMMQTELDLERRHARAVPCIRRYVASLRTAGSRPLFISDMYLPADFIRELLQSLGLAHPGDPLYVSSEFGATKHEGGLFDLVLDRENLKPKDLVHVGDNPWSDCSQARSKGIAAVHFDTALLNEAEHALLQAPLGVDLVRSRMAGAARCARLGQENQGALAELASSLIAPLLCLFTARTMSHARRRGAKALHFVSRDGHLLYKIAQRFGCADVALNYLHGSRQAWFFPALDFHSADWLDHCFVQGHSIMTQDILRRLKLTPKELCEIVGDDALEEMDRPRQLNGGEIEKLKERLNCPAVRERLAQEAQRQRTAFAAYLEKQGVDGDGDFHIVDVGWTLKSQHALQRILRLCGHDAMVYGHYLGVAATRCSAGLEGRYSAMFVETDRGLTRDEPANALLRNANVIEQVFLGSEQPSVAGYAEDGEVLYMADGRPEGLKEAIRLIHDVTLDYATNMSEALLEESTFREQSAVVSARLKDFLTDPDPRYVTALTDVTIGDDQNESRRRALVRKVTPGMALHWLGAKWFGLKKPEYADSFDWIEGSAALSGPIVRRALTTRFGFEEARTMRKSL